MKTDTDYPRFREALRDRRAAPTAIATVLAWLMMADGEANPREIGYLDAFRSAQGIDERLMSEITEIGLRASTVELALSIEILSSLLGDEGKWLLLDLVLGMVMADGRIHFAEKILIELVVDALGLSTHAFRQRYHEVTGREYESAGDVSSARWWAAFETGKRNEHRQGGRDDRRRTHASSESNNRARRQALVVLGLEEDASQDKIVAAFRRLAKVHHPDRFQTLGPEAQRAAHETFIRIKNAYDMLRAA